jgi:activator of HSP90 ATPase
MHTRHSGPSQLVISRRRWLAKSLAAASGLALAPLAIRAQQAATQEALGGGVSHDAEAIHQQVSMPVVASKVYEVLTNAALFQKMSLFSTDVPEALLNAHPAQLSGEPGSAFSLFGGMIEGRQIELVPAKRVIQAWRANDWDPGLYSIARFELSGATKIVFDQTGFPEGAGEHLARGWHSHYWNGMMKLFSS